MTVYTCVNYKSIALYETSESIALYEMINNCHWLKHSNQ